MLRALAITFLVLFGPIFIPLISIPITHGMDSDLRTAERSWNEKHDFESWSSYLGSLKRGGVSDSDDRVAFLVLVGTALGFLPAKHQTEALLAHNVSFQSSSLDGRMLTVTDASLISHLIRAEFRQKVFSLGNLLTIVIAPYGTIETFRIEAWAGQSDRYATSVDPENEDAEGTWQVTDNHLPAFIANTYALFVITRDWRPHTEESFRMLASTPQARAGFLRQHGYTPDLTSPETHFWRNTRPMLRCMPSL